MKRARIILMALLVVPAAADAQTTGAQSVPSGEQFSIRGFGDAGVTIFTARQSFDAILGRPSGALLGGGVEVGVTSHMVLSVSASRFRRTGHRVFVFQGQVFNLGIPATIGVTPIEIMGAYRFSTSHGWIPYTGGGVGFHRYDETSTPAMEGDDVHATYVGYQVLGGLEKRASKWIAAAVEAQLTSVPNALGKDPSGVSHSFDEHNLGGFTLRLKVAFGR